MNQKIISILCIILITSLLLSACDISITINPSEESGSNSPQEPAPTKKPPNTPRPPATKAPSTNSAEIHDIYAGFTDNVQVPFVVLHRNGEQISVVQDTYSGNKTGIVWKAQNKKPIFFNADEIGRPTYAVVGDDVVKYTNYTNSTVDITVIHTNGTAEYFRIAYDSDFVRKIRGSQKPLYQFAAFTTNDPLKAFQQDAWDYLDYVFIGVGAVSCVGLATAASPVLLLVAASCGGLILDIGEKVAEANNVDVKLVQAIDMEGGLFDSLGCVASNFGDCLEVVANVAEITYKQGTEIIANMKPPESAPGSESCKGKYCN